jgi:UPF0755 protein
MKKLFLIIIGLIAAGALGTIIWYELGLRAVSPQGGVASQTYHLAPGTKVSELAADLEEKGIIRNHTAFVWFVTLHGLRRDLQAGTYELDPSDSAKDIADIISHGKVSVNRVVLPEGITIAKIKQLLEPKGISAKDFSAALQEQYSNDFVQAKPADVDLEGYLFPDSYEISKPVRPHALIQTMLDNFATKVNSTDVVKSYSSEGLTLHQGLTLASIVEKEASKPEDRPIIAQVFLKRLIMGMPLGSDVTVIYAADQLGVPFSTSINSAYNTYTHKGLPPGPICNPGLDAMKAVAHPANTDYLYFLADKNGTVHYAKTAAEHQANVKKYLQ